MYMCVYLSYHMLYVYMTNVHIYIRIQMHTYQHIYDYLMTNGITLRCHLEVRQHAENQDIVQFLPSQRRQFLMYSVPGTWIPQGSGG